MTDEKTVGTGPLAKARKTMGTGPLALARGPVPVVFKTFQNAEGGADMIRKRITFYGRVQGVGFRYRARYAAEMFSCTGWVRNEWDGTVTMEIQGDPNNIDQVLLSIVKGRFVRVEDMIEEHIPLKDGEYAFRAG